MNAPGLAVVWLMALLAEVAQGGESAVRPVFKSLRYDEDYTSLRDPGLRLTPLDAIKFLPLAADGTTYISLGGEARGRYERIHNSSWGRGAQDRDGFLLQRYMLHADLHFSGDWRLFAQLKSGLEEGRVGGPRATDEDRLDLHQAFVDGSLFKSAGSELVLRVGRQEFDYGSSRLISAREGPNVRLAFDGIRAIAHYGRWHTDIFVARPVRTGPGVWDDAGDDSQMLWGVYATRLADRPASGNVDLYYLGLHRQNATFEQGTAREQRHSIGTRIWGKNGARDYNFELVYQFGSFGEGIIRAWTAASDLGVTFLQVAWRPRLGLKVDITSGDRDPRSATLQTFNPLFPRGAYFGEPALVGPANHVDIHPSLSLKPIRSLTLQVDWIRFWRQQRGDGVYGPAGNLLAAGVAGQGKSAGEQVEAKLDWSINRHVSLTVDAARFLALKFLKEATPGRTVGYTSAWMVVRW